MTKLKTLKDFGLCGNEQCCARAYDKELRQEAIKWIKEDLEGAGTGDMECLGRVGIMKEFFNITEEDLK